MECPAPLPAAVVFDFMGDGDYHARLYGLLRETDPAARGIVARVHFVVCSAGVVVVDDHC